MNSFIDGARVVCMILGFIAFCFAGTWAIDFLLTAIGA